MNKHLPVVAQFATVEGRSLSAGLKPLLFVVERRNTYPILGMVKLQLDGTQLRVSATDLNIEISTSLDVNDCAGEWSLCVDARTLGGIARVAGPMLIRLERLDQAQGVDAKGQNRTETQLKVELDSGAVTYVIGNVAEADAWPVLKGGRGNEVERFTNGRLAASLAKVERVISREETRYYLNGVCWTIGYAGRWVAATDGHRLLKYAYDKTPGTPCQRIIPRKTVELLVRYFGGADAIVYSEGEKIDLDIGGFSVRSKLIEGNYPDINRVIPKAGGEKLALQVAELNAALARLSAFPGRPGSVRAVRFFRGEDGRAAANFQNEDLGSATVPLSSTWPESMSEFGLGLLHLLDRVAPHGDQPVEGPAFLDVNPDALAGEVVQAPVAPLRGVGIVDEVLDVNAGVATRPGDPKLLAHQVAI